MDFDEDVVVVVVEDLGVDFLGYKRNSLSSDNDEVRDEVDENERIDKSAPADESDAHDAPDEDEDDDDEEEIDFSLAFLSLLLAILFTGLE